jgi:glycosyltransferase involved in cell wall biosynthesis
MSFGKPVIVPQMGCLPELVTKNTGFLYCPLDDQALSQAIQKAMIADLGSMGQEAYHRAEMFSWEQMATQTMKVYGFT